MPTPVSLANAGRKLLGPPEAYGRRKELQVKQWLLQVLPTKDEEPVDVAEAQVNTSRQVLGMARGTESFGMGVCLKLDNPYVTSTFPTHIL